MGKNNKPPNILFYIALIAFVVIIGFVAYFLSPTNAHYNPSNNYAAENSYPDSRSLTVLHPDIDPIKNITKPTTERDKEKHVAERSDLAAQWAMAHYTFVGLIVGVIGVILIILTFYQSSRAAYFTEQALHETKMANRRSQRAYIAIERAFVQKITAGYPIELKITIENFGQTPARITASNSTFQWGWQGEDYTIKLKEGTSDIIPPNGKRHYEIISDFNATKQHIDSIMTAEGAIAYGWVFVKYTDVFNVERLFTYAAHVSNSISKNASLGYAFAREVEIHHEKNQT